MAAEETPTGFGITPQHRQAVLAWLHLRRIHTLIVSAENCVVGEFGLTIAQFDVLTHIANQDGISQQALADRLLVTKGNVGGIIDRMEQAGLVRRLRDPDDRRAYRLSVTPRGFQLLRQAAPALEATIGERLSALDEDEQAALLKLLSRLDRDLHLDFRR